VIGARVTFYNQNSDQLLCTFYKHIGGPDRFIALNQTHNCTNSYSPDSPMVEKDTCEIVDENFVTLIEHGDM